MAYIFSRVEYRAITGRAVVHIVRTKVTRVTIRALSNYEIFETVKNTCRISP